MQRSWKNAEGRSENRKEGVKGGEEEKVGRKKRGVLIFEGAYFHGVLINTCNILVVSSCVGRDML